MEVKDSVEHVAAVATTMDQTGVVLHFVEMRIISQTLSCLHPTLVSIGRLINTGLFEENVYLKS